MAHRRKLTKAASGVYVSNLERGAGLTVTETWDDEYGWQAQVSDGDRILYQGPSGLRFDAWANGFCKGRGLL